MGAFLSPQPKTTVQTQSQNAILLRMEVEDSCETPENTSKQSQMSRLINGLPLKCALCNHLVVASVEKISQIVCDNQADARYCLLLACSITCSHQPTLFISNCNLERTLWRLGQRSGQTESSPSPKQESGVQVESARGPTEREQGLERKSEGTEGKTEGRLEAMKEGRQICSSDTGRCSKLYQICIPYCMIMGKKC